MLRQNHSASLSTSRSRAKTAMSRPSGRPSNSATKNASGSFSLRNHFSSFHLFRPTSRSQAPPEAPYFFRRNHSSSCSAAEPVRLEQPGKSGSARGPPHSFRGNHFSSFLPAEIGCPAAPVDRLAENYCTFFEGTTFPPSFAARDWRSRKHGHWADWGPPHFFQGNHFPSFR